MAQEGYVRVRTSAARGVYPVKNAVVTVLIEGEKVGESRTDESGNSEKMPLAAPPAALSQTPGGEQPFAIYDVRIDAEGFVPLIVRGVPVFDEQTSVLQVSLVPSFAAGGRTQPIVRDNKPGFTL